MTAERQYLCKLCGYPIEPAMVRGKSCAREATSWVIFRKGRLARHLHIRYGKGAYAHNACVEAAYARGGIIGQTEAFPTEV